MTTPIHPPPAPELPAWAYLISDQCQLVPGYDLHSGDTLYFSSRAYPRILWTQLSRRSWSVLVYKHGIHQRGQIEIEPHDFYVVKRAVRKG